MKKIYTASLPNSAALRADSGQMGTEILMPASSIGVPQKFTTIATPQQVALIGSEGIKLNVPNGLFTYVTGYLYYEQGGFDEIDVLAGGGGNMSIVNDQGNILTKQAEVDIAAGDVLALERYTAVSTPAVAGTKWELIFESAPTNTDFGRLQITLYLIPLDLAIP
jgi:hypothetical protein